MTFSKLHITVFLGLAAVAWGLILLIRGTPISMEYLKPFSFVVSFLVLVGLAFEHVLWRQGWLQGWFIKRPDLRGTWRVEMKSDWVNLHTGEQASSIVCYMGVKQTLSTLQMHLMTSESESWFIASDILPSPSGKGYQLAGVYTNKPHIDLRSDRSEMHRGALILDTHGPTLRPKTLSGEYWTDRKTSGKMDFIRRLPEVATHYDDAERLFASEEGSTNG